MSIRSARFHPDRNRGEHPQQERYPHNNTIKVYRTLLGVLSSQPRAMDWKEFNQEDWEAFARIAIQEGVAGCVYWHLKNGDYPIHYPPMTLGVLGA